MIPVKRISDAKAAGVKSISVEYASACPFSNDNAHLLLQQSDGFIRLHDGTTGALVKKLTGVIASSEPRWSRTEDNVFFFVKGNALCRYDVRTDGILTVRTFNEYSKISGLGESDISEDGDHFAFVGDGKHVFVYELTTNRKYPSFAAQTGLNGLYVTPDNNVLCGSPSGVWFFDKQGNMVRQVAQKQGHMDVMRDNNGDEVLIRTTADDTPEPADCKNGIQMVRLVDASVNCLWAIGWPASHKGEDALAVHISCPVQGFALVSAYNWHGTQPNQVFEVPVDRSGPKLLCDTGTFSKAYATKEESYPAQPKASIARRPSHDGSHPFVFCSDKDGAVDVWMGVLSTLSDKVDNGVIDSPNNIPSVITITHSDDPPPDHNPAHQAITATPAVTTGEQWKDMGSLPYDEESDLVCFNSRAKNITVYRRVKTGN